MDENPYDPPISSSVPPQPSDAARRVARAAGRILFSLLVVAAFSALVAGAVWLFYNGYPWPVGVGVLAAFMIAALFLQGPWCERIVISLSVPFLALGGVAGMLVYVAMFSFDWFEHVFNSKGAGPLGLLLFVIGFSVAAWLGAAACLDWAARCVWPLTKSGDSAAPKAARPASGP